MIIRKGILVAACFCAASVVGFALGNGNGNGNGNGQNGQNGQKNGQQQPAQNNKANGQVMQGQQPLVTQPNDHMSGTVTAVKVNGNMAYVTVDTDDGSKMAVVTSKEGKKLQPGDEVQMHGRRMFCNGQEVLRCDKCKKKSSVNRCSNVKTK